MARKRPTTFLVNGMPLGWLPVKTAPRNEPVLFYDEEWEMTLGAIQIGSIDDDGTGRTAESDEFHPTHWMPLPAPPAR